MGYRKDPKTGTWVVWFNKRHPITRQSRGLRRRGIKTEAMARRIERELVAEVERKFHESIIPNWLKVVDEFLEHSENRGITKHTIHDYSCGLRAYTFDPWGDRLVDSITTKEIRELILTKAGCKSPSYQKNLLKFIRAVFNYSVEAGYVNRNPTPKMKIQIGSKIKKVLTEEQVKLLLNKAKQVNHEWYPHWMMALYTGMRNGELYALTWDKVNLEVGQILVNESWNSKDGFKETKSGDDRLIPINQTDLQPFLKQLKLQSPDSHFVLPRIDKWDKGEQARELRLFLTSVNLPEIRFHDLRATWATLLLGKGVEALKVMTMGGWKDYKTMMIYIRKAGVDIQGATDRLQLHNPSLEPAKVLDFGIRGLQ